MATICLQWAPISRLLCSLPSVVPSYNTRKQNFFYTLIYLKKLILYCHVHLCFGHLFTQHQASPFPAVNIICLERPDCILWYLQASNNTLVPLLPIATPFTIPEWDISTSDKSHFPLRQWRPLIPRKTITLSRDPAEFSNPALLQQSSNSSFQCHAQASGSYVISTACNILFMALPLNPLEVSL